MEKNYQQNDVSDDCKETTVCPLVLHSYSFWQFGKNKKQNIDKNAVDPTQFVLTKSRAAVEEDKSRNAGKK